jgi:hypothetical protein
MILFDFALGLFILLWLFGLKIAVYMISPVGFNFINTGLQPNCGIHKE